MAIAPFYPWQIGICNSNLRTSLPASPHATSELQSQIAGRALLAYSKRRMGQQHRVVAKRKRRKAYLERKRVSANAPRRSNAKPRAKKAAAAAT